MKELDGSGALNAPIVTQLAPLENFYPAEDYHNEYYSQNPNQPYCRFVIDPKVAKFRTQYFDKLKKSSTGT